MEQDDQHNIIEKETTEEDKQPKEEKIEQVIYINFNLIKVTSAIEELTNILITHVYLEW